MALYLVRPNPKQNLHNLQKELESVSIAKLELSEKLLVMVCLIQKMMWMVILFTTIGNGEGGGFG